MNFFNANQLYFLKWLASEKNAQLPTQRHTRMVVNELSDSNQLYFLKQLAFANEAVGVRKECSTLHATTDGARLSMNFLDANQLQFVKWLAS